jgi:hypothetical protein
MFSPSLGPSSLSVLPTPSSLQSLSQLEFSSTFYRQAYHHPILTTASRLNKQVLLNYIGSIFDTSYVALLVSSWIKILRSCLVDNIVMFFFLCFVFVFWPHFNVLKLKNLDEKGITFWSILSGQEVSYLPCKFKAIVSWCLVTSFIKSAPHCYLF